MNRILWKGDRVRVRHQPNPCDVKKGKTGTVLEVGDGWPDYTVKFVQDGRNTFHEVDRNVLAKMNDQSPNEGHLPFLEEQPNIPENSTVKDFFEKEGRFPITEQELHDLYVSCFQQEFQRIRTDERNEELVNEDIVEMAAESANLMVAYLDHVFHYEIVLAKEGK